MKREAATEAPNAAVAAEMEKIGNQFLAQARLARARGTTQTAEAAIAWEKVIAQTMETLTKRPA